MELEAGWGWQCLGGSLCTQTSPCPLSPPTLNVPCKSNFPKCLGDPNKDRGGSRAEGEGMERAAGQIGSVGFGLPHWNHRIITECHKL